MRKLQATATINLQIPLMNVDGTPAIGESANCFTKIIGPDGLAVTGYTEATFTEPNSDGTYNVQFPSNAVTKAFILEDQANPYTVTLDSPTADVEPTPDRLWIVSQYPWEDALETTSQEILDQVTGTGNRVITINVKDDGANNLQDVLVRIGEASRTTDVSGNAVFALNDGNYDVILKKQFVTFVVPESLTVAGDGTHPYVGTIVTPSAPTQPDTCVVYGTVIDDGGNLVPDAEISIKETNDATFSNAQKIVKSTETTSDANGFWELEKIRSSELDPNTSSYEAIITYGDGAFRFVTEITVPDADQVEFSTIANT